MKKTRIAVLGASGMLGNAVGHYFNSHHKYDVQLSFRSLKYRYGNSSFHFDALNERSIDRLPEVDYVINCIGCIPQRDYDVRTLMQVNAQFPHFLANLCEKRGIRLIHITTDCAFSGKTGDYNELAKPDAVDIYGISKELGEPQNCMVLRTSVIGRELRTKYSLLEWVSSLRKGTNVNGYMNHVWNGVTNVEYAKICDKIISHGFYENVKRHVFSDVPLSKYQMLLAFNKSYKLGLNIKPFQHSEHVNRSLSTVYSLNRKLEIPTFQQMLEELKEY